MFTRSFILGFIFCGGDSISPITSKLASPILFRYAIFSAMPPPISPLLFCCQVNSSRVMPGAFIFSCLCNVLTLIIFKFPEVIFFTSRQSNRCMRYRKDLHVFILSPQITSLFVSMLNRFSLGSKYFLKFLQLSGYYSLFLGMILIVFSLSSIIVQDKADLHVSFRFS